MKKAVKNQQNCDDTSHTYEPRPLAFALSMVLSVLAWLLLGPSLARLTEPLRLPYLTANAPFIAMAGGFLAARQLLLKQPLMRLVTDHHAFQTSLFTKSFLIYFASATLFLIVDLQSNPQFYQPMAGSSISNYLLLLPLVLFFTPLQTSIEELVFRMLPVRTINANRLDTKSIMQIVTSLISALVFALPHLGNREVAIASNRLVVVLYYALFGFMVTYLCMKHKGFETALAIHAANNLFIALVCNHPSSSLPSLPLLQTSRPIGTVYDLGQLCISLALVALLTRNHKES